MSTRLIFGTVVIFILLPIGIAGLVSAIRYGQTRNRERLLDDLHKAIYSVLIVISFISTSLLFIILYEPDESDRSLASTQTYIKQTQEAFFLTQTGFDAVSRLLTQYPPLATDLAQQQSELRATQTQLENEVTSLYVTQTSAANLLLPELVNITPSPSATLYTLEDIQAALTQTAQPPIITPP